MSEPITLIDTFRKNKVLKAHAIEIFGDIIEQAYIGTYLYSKGWYANPKETEKRNAEKRKILSEYKYTKGDSIDIESKFDIAIKFVKGNMVVFSASEWASIQKIKELPLESK